MKISMKSAKRLGIMLIGLFLVLNLFVPAFPAAAQTSVEVDFLTLLNAERTSAGKSSLIFNASLTSAAYLHSKDMAENGYFSHTSLDGRTLAQRASGAGYTNYYALGENIAYAYGAPDAAKVYSMWKNSPGHYTNMMGNYYETGLGIYSLNGYTYYTLDLGRSSNPAPAPTADFSCSASPTTLNIKAGSSAVATVVVTSLNGFAATVGLATATVPPDWTAAINPISLAASPGVPQSATFSISVPATAQAGAYKIMVTGTSGTKNHTVTVTVNVQNIPTPAPTMTPTPTATIKNLNIAVATNSPAYARNTYGSATVSVTDSITGKGLSRASVILKLYYPNGGTAGTVYRTSDTNGNVAVYFRLSSTAPPGTYKIVTTASRSGYQTGTGQTQFTVN